MNNEKFFNFLVSLKFRVHRRRVFLPICFCLFSFCWQLLTGFFPISLTLETHVYICKILWQKRDFFRLPKYVLCKFLTDWLNYYICIVKDQSKLIPTWPNLYPSAFNLCIWISKIHCQLGYKENTYICIARRVNTRPWVRYC